MTSTKPDLNDPVLADAMAKGRMAHQNDKQYDDYFVRLAQFVFGSAPVVMDVFKDTNPVVAEQEKKLLATLFLLWPAIPDLSDEEKIEKLGESGNALLDEILGMESPEEWPYSKLSPLARKAMRLEEAFLKRYTAIVQPVPDPEPQSDLTYHFVRASRPLTAYEQAVFDNAVYYPGMRVH